VLKVTPPQAVKEAALVQAGTAAVSAAYIAASDDAGGGSRAIEREEGVSAPSGT
jgi:hypothetical protein